MLEFSKVFPDLNSHLFDVLCHSRDLMNHKCRNRLLDGRKQVPLQHRNTYHESLVSTIRSSGEFLNLIHIYLCSSKTTNHAQFGVSLGLLCAVEDSP
jgi:hypothetical protein